MSPGSSQTRSASWLSSWTSVSSTALGVAAIVTVLATAACPSSDYHRARELEKAGKLREAGELYVEAAQFDPANLAAWDGAISVWCTKEANVAECMRVLDLELSSLGSLVRHKDALAEVLERRGRARLEQGLVDAALEDFDRARTAAPERASVLAAKARALMMKGDRRGALTAIEEAQHLDASNEEAKAVLSDLPEEDEDEARRAPRGDSEPVRDAAREPKSDDSSFGGR